MEWIVLRRWDLSHSNRHLWSSCCVPRTVPVSHNHTIGQRSNVRLQEAVLRWVCRIQREVSSGHFRAGEESEEMGKGKGFQALQEY